MSGSTNLPQSGETTSSETKGPDGLISDLSSLNDSQESHPMARRSLSNLSFSSAETNTTFRPVAKPKKSSPKPQRSASDTEERPLLADLYQTRDKWHTKGTSNMSLASSNGPAVMLGSSKSGDHRPTDFFKVPTQPAPKQRTSLEAEIRHLREKLAMERTRRKQTEAILRQLTKSSRSGNSTSLNSTGNTTSLSVSSNPELSANDTRKTPTGRDNFYQSTSLFSQLPGRVSTPLDHQPSRRRTEPPRIRPGTKEGQSGQPPAWFIPTYRPRNSTGSNRTSASSSQSLVPLVDLQTVPTLEECLKSRKQEFLWNSRYRQQQIQEASEIRHQADEQLRLLARDIAEGHQTLPPATAINALDMAKRSVRAFDVGQMVTETRRKYQKLPEIQQKHKQLERQLEYKTNRIQAEMFKQQLLYKLSLRNDAKQMTSG